MLTTVFRGIIITSCLGVALTLVLLLLKPITKKHFGATWHYYIWLGVLVVMMLPIKIDLNSIKESAVFVQAEEWVQENLHIDELFAKKPKVQYDEQGRRLLSPRLQEQRIREIAWEKMAERWEPILISVWWKVALLLLAERILIYRIFINKMKRKTIPVICPEIARYTNRKVSVRVGEEILSPQLVGVVCPILLLPQREFTEEQLHNVLLHEMTHLERNDLLYKWLLVLARCVHWFNPMIYPLTAQVKQECEISCDIRATRGMSNQERMSYVDTILAMTSRQVQRRYTPTMGMTGSKMLLRKRFLAMKNGSNVGGSVRILSASLAVMVLVCAMLTGGNLIYRTSPKDDNVDMPKWVSECEHCHQDILFSDRTAELRMEGEVRTGFLIMSYQCKDCKVAWTEEQAIKGEYITEFNGKVCCVIRIEQLGL